MKELRIKYQVIKLLICYFSNDNFIEILFQDKFCLQSLQIHWNSEWFGSFTELLNQITINYKESDNFNSVLQLSRTDLLNIQNSSLEFCINTCLSDVTKAASHQEKIDLVIKLYG